VSDALTKDRASSHLVRVDFRAHVGTDGAGLQASGDAWPDDTYSSTQKKLFFNDEPVLIMHVPSTTDGYSIVHFRLDDVVSVGDLIDMTSYPYIDVRPAAASTRRRRAQPTARASRCRTPRASSARS
jgi:hypothetical protein